MARDEVRFTAVVAAVQAVVKFFLGASRTGGDTNQRGMRRGR
jgi:hypothetical protein